ncbi:MAG TPA: hypothetical protein V6C96_02175 [Vampirovibrionales bacterium]
MSIVFPFNVLSFTVDEDPFATEPQVLERKESLNFYNDKFCMERGRRDVFIQNGIKVDCMTYKTLWKIGYADEWREVFTEALTYQIYDDYSGSEGYAPNSGIVLVQENADDFKSMLKLKQLIKFYKLPLRLSVIENYAAKTQEEKRQNKKIKDFLVDFGL